MTYLLIGIPFILGACALWAWRRGSAPRQAAVTAIVAAVLVALTTIFDNAMILAGLVGYDDARMSGLFIGVMPVEDLLYAVVAAIAVPALWNGHARPAPGVAARLPLPEGAGKRGPGGAGSRRKARGNRDEGTGQPT